MDWLNTPLRLLISGYVSLFGDAHPLVSLIPLSIVVGIGMLWVFKVTSDQKAIERAKKKMQAYLLELRLYGDDPRLLFSAQKNLIVSNLKYIGLMFKPAIYLTIPMVFLLVHMDAVYGVAPLSPGESAILTVQAAGRLAPTVSAPRLDAPDIFAIDTPPVRALSEGQFSWRVRAIGEGEGRLQFDWDGRKWDKTIRSDGPNVYVSHRRTASTWESLIYAGEDRLDAQDIEWVDLAYPPKEIQTGSVSLHWLIWFLVISIVAAYALKGVFGVQV